jgi:hypothetical protein
VANVTEKARGTLWAEADTVNDLENITANTGQNISPYKLFLKHKLKIYAQLIKFGHLGYITIYHKFTAKWKKRSFKAVMVG